MGKTIYWELNKKLKFNHNDKKNMHKPESVLENEPHKIRQDFEIDIAEDPEPPPLWMDYSVYKRRENEKNKN